MAIQNNLRLLMAKHKIKDYGVLAKRVNHPYSSVRGLANGTYKNVNMELLNDLCELFDCEVQDILYIKKNKKAGA